LWPTSVSPLSSWVVNTIWSKGGALEVLLGGEGKPAPILQADARPAPQT